MISAAPDARVGLEDVVLRRRPRVVVHPLLLKRSDTMKAGRSAADIPTCRSD